jgi:hypothetical protein
MLPFRLVVPSSQVGNARKRKRHPANGLTLNCTRIAASRLQGAALRNLAVELKDVAWGGVRFIASEALDVSTLVNLNLRKEDSGQTLQARGVVAWVETSRVNGQDVRLAGAKFEEIVTPPAKAAWYFEDLVAPQPKPWAPSPVKAVAKPRTADRFAIAGSDVVLERDHRFRTYEKAGNLASRLLDLSRSGAQVLCTDPVKRGERMRLTVDFKDFKDIFSAEAETVWVRYPGAGETGWRVGLSFCSLNHSQQRQLLSLESWFRGSNR